MKRYLTIGRLSAELALALMLPTTPPWMRELREVASWLILGEIVGELCGIGS